MTLAELRYEPRWYHLGDPDSNLFALAYSGLALGTLFLSEYICAALLFSGARGILISDAAAHITFAYSSWLQIFRWAFVRPPLLQPDRRICRRAVLAIFLRVAVIAVDFAILGMSIPHSINMYEKDVGTTMISFADVPKNITSVSRAVAHNSPCKPDPIQYTNFNPTANRRLCMTIEQSPEVLRRKIPIDWDIYDVFAVIAAIKEAQIMIIHFNLEAWTHFSHVLQIENNTQYLLPLPTGIQNEASNTLMKLYPGNCKIFNRNATLSSNNIICIKPKTKSELQDDGKTAIKRLFALFETRPLKKGVVQKKVKDFTIPVGKDDLRVGTLARPRLCIFPALIMFGCFFAIAAALRWTKGKHDLAYKQWAYISLCFGSPNSENPLYSDCTEFAEWKTARAMGSSVDLEVKK